MFLPGVVSQNVMADSHPNSRQIAAGYQLGNNCRFQKVTPFLTKEKLIFSNCNILAKALPYNILDIIFFCHVKPGAFSLTVNGFRLFKICYMKRLSVICIHFTMNR